jgi:hypothetical protein
MVECRRFGRLKVNGCGGVRFSQARYFCPVGLHRGLFLFTTPAFDLLLSSEGFFTSWKILRKNQLQRTALEGVASGNCTRAVLINSRFQVVGVAGVVAGVGAAQDVNVKSHHVRSSFNTVGLGRPEPAEGFDRLSPNGYGFRLTALA